MTMNTYGKALKQREVVSSPREDKRSRHWRQAQSARGQSRNAPEVAAEYAELHAHSCYSWKEGASLPAELLTEAAALGMKAVALTDHNSLTGAMEFAQAAKSVGIRGILGAEITLTSGHHLTLLAETADGYSNISRLVTHAYLHDGDRLDPRLDPERLREHAAGVICLSGCRNSEMASLVDAGRLDEAREVAQQYRDWFGEQNYFIELQNNLVRGDVPRIRALSAIGEELGIPLVATNNVHYHVRDRHRLQDALVAIRLNRTLEETYRERRPTSEFHLKSPRKMARIFREWPVAIRNTVHIAERCDFDLTEQHLYSFPDYETPDGSTPLTHLRKLSAEAAVRRYGAVTPQVRDRLDKEFRLIDRHGLAGFLLMYRDIIVMAREIQEELGLVEPGLPVEVQPPGRGRGSSVSMLTGYLIGLSHIDPLQFELRLDRFLPDDELTGPPDIDLDFPREIRERLILRVHERWGFEKAALTGMIVTYHLRGAVRDLGKALGLPLEDIDQLAKAMDGHHSGGGGLADHMGSLPAFKDRVDAPLWNELVKLSSELVNMPKGLAQHPGGMVLSARPLPEVVPVQPSAIDGRAIIQWDKDSADDAGMVKIDFLALGALSQMQEALGMIRVRHEERIDLSRIDFEDPAVYAAIHSADTLGVFQVESAAQMQTVVRLRPDNLVEMAWEVGCVRPGVGVNDGVTLLIQRHREKKAGLPRSWDYDHPLEEPALGRTYGVPLYQDQLQELAVHVAGLSSSEGDRMRRVFSRRDRDRMLPIWRERFMQGAAANGVPKDAAERIYRKFNGFYQFPESHAYAFGVTAYQMQWLKVRYPVEFYVALVNQQPMGFYSVESIKQDARRHGTRFLNPDVNRSDRLAVIDDEAIRLGLAHVAGVRDATANIILAARDRHGPFTSLADFMRRTGVERRQLDSLSAAGAFDALDRGDIEGTDRRSMRWEAGLRYRPVGAQLMLNLPVEQDMVDLQGESGWEGMTGEYRAMGVYPSGHLMESVFLRLPRGVTTSEGLKDLPDGARVMVAGVVIRRQRPNAKAVFITLEDQFGHVPLILWESTYERLRRVVRQPVLIATGEVSRREGTLNVVVSSLTPVPVDAPKFQTKDWG